MHYVSIPMNATDCPRLEQTNAFLKITSEVMGKFFVHCAGGRHRTGVMGAVYRSTNSRWNFDRVYSEMLLYGFYTRWGHGALKTFVEDYSRRQRSGACSRGLAETWSTDANSRCEEA